MLQYFRPVSPVQWAWLGIKGPDASDFLHRLTTVNVKTLHPGLGSAGFFLTPQGKIRAYFRLWMMSPGEFFLEFDAGVTGKWMQQLMTVIDQFHFGEKFTLETAPDHRPELKSIWIFTDSSHADFNGLPTNHFRKVSDLVFYNHGATDFGKNWLTVWGDSAATDRWLNDSRPVEIAFDELEAMRILSGRPWIDSELTENTIPLEAGLRDAIADNKGCYPGQEVIEKIISLGSPARRLSQMEGVGPAPHIGDAVKTMDTSQEIGQVTSVSKTQTGFRALAYVRKTHAKAGLEVIFHSPSPATPIRAKLLSISP